MIDVRDATELILNESYIVNATRVALKAATGYVLAEPIAADRDLPPFHRVAMDGIAIHYESFENGHLKYPIESIAAAGKPRATLSNKLHCIEIMTGAALPANTDTVIRYEDVAIENGIATIANADISKGQNIHFQAQDGEAGDILVREHTVLSPAEIGIAATVGLSEISVYRPLRVAIISNGDELVDIDKKPLPHQIRKSNVWTLFSLLKNWKTNTTLYHLPDNEPLIKGQLHDIIKENDILLLSGGVSMGQFDLVPKVLDTLGVRQIFHKVRQRPGKPFWFGRVQDGPIVFAFPGNPVSTLVCALRYFIPWMRVHHGLNTAKTPCAKLSEDVIFKRDFTYFLQVSVDFKSNGSILATPVKGHGSGDLANLALVDGFLELPRGINQFEKGSAYPLHLFRNIL